MAGGPERLLEERIRDDVSGIIAATGRMPELAYMVSPADAMEIGSRVIMRRVRLKAPSAIEVHTDGGWVEVIADENCPRGVACRSYRCSCGALFVDDSSQSGKCVVCTMRGLEDRAGRVAERATVSCSLCGKPTMQGSEEALKRHHSCQVYARLTELRQQEELAQARRDQMQRHRVSYAPNGDARIECTTKTQVEPADIDGLSPMKCYERWASNRAATERGLGQPMYALTSAQMAAGRAAYQRDALAEWSAELRAKVAASKERERNVVRIDLDDDAC